MAYWLGLDVGTNSIGWAAVKIDGDRRPCEILDMGVRVFSDGRNPKDGTSLAFQRRIPRSQRRRRDRYLHRRRELVDALTACGLMPPDVDGRHRVAQLDPHALRARALDRKLTPYALGRALFHLHQRRGFKSNRQVDQDGNETSVTKQAAQALAEHMAARNARTLGEFLNQQRRLGRPTRFRNLGTGAAARYEFYPTREMLEDEFDQIRAAQAPHHRLRPDQWDSLRDIVFYQRPLRPVDPGRCALESGEQRAARALPLAQEFRTLQELNNLRLRVGIEPERPLHADERARALQRLRSGKDINLQKPTRDLRLPPGAALNLGRGGRTVVNGDETAARLMAKKERNKPSLEIFGARWPALSLDERNEIVRCLLQTEAPETVRRKAQDDWGLGEAAAAAVAAASMPAGYLNVSEKAIRRLLPHLEAGLAFSEAATAANYPQHSDVRSASAHERLPYYGAVLERDVVGGDPTKDPQSVGEPARYGRFPNPTVHIGLNQLRRVVNRIVDVYGKPEEIVVELARDLKSNRRQRRRHRQQQQENEARDQKFRTLLQAAGIADTPHTLRKLRLWEEQGPAQARVCPYTGTPITFAMAASSQTEIGHILPFSRTLNASIANQALCLTRANRHKGDHAPFEAFGHNPPGYDYDAIRSRAAEFPANKRWRFDPDAMQRFDDGGDFLDRQLNETRYLARTARAYLAHLYDEKTEGRRRVRVIPGRMTSVLRRGWGLESLLRAAETDEIVRKQRDDHRHHAIDALVVACTTPGLLQRFAHAASRYDAAERLAALVPPPWEGFDRRDVEQALDRLVVSHKPDHGSRGRAGATTGQLHNETAYGLVELAPDGPSTIVVRKPLSTLNLPRDLECVRDPALRGALKDLWLQVGASGGGAAEFAERAATGVQLNGRRQRVRRVRVQDVQRVIPIRDAAGRPYKGYTPGGNEFVDVWRLRDGTWKLVVVPRFDFNQIDFDIERFRPADKSSGTQDPLAKRLMRLHIDDMGALGEGSERRIVRVRKASGDRIWLDDHHEANVPSRIRKRELKERKYSARQLQALGFRKVGVDEIGRVRDPGPRPP